METRSLFVRNATAAAAVAGLSLFVGLAGDARAAGSEVDACGGVLFLSTPSCQVLTTEACMTECTPVATREVCASRLTRTCDESCTSTATVACAGACATSCVESCTTTTTEEPPNCNGLCMSDCQQDCNEKCSGPLDNGRCRSSCAHTCANECEPGCEGETSTDCDPVCATACAGACVASANIECQVSCQDEQFTTCETTVVRECRESCETNGLAIFCDGQFLAAEDLQACADQLLAEFSISVDVSASVRAGGDLGVGCDVQGCAVGARGRERAEPLGAIALLGLCAFAIVRARRGRR